MINVSNVTLSYGRKVLFKDVNLKFTPGNCYGLIGANGAGKSTFLNILSGDVEPDKSEVAIGPKQRLSVLRQDSFAFEDETVINTVIRGHARLYEVMEAREALYAKSEFSEEEGMLLGKLEGEFAEMNGYETESAAVLLKGLGIPEALLPKKMKGLDGGDKVRVLLAQALYGNPDVLLMDEPINHLDMESLTALNNGLIAFPEVLLFASRDYQLVPTAANRIVEITPAGIIDRMMGFDE